MYYNCTCVSVSPTRFYKIFYQRSCIAISTDLLMQSTKILFHKLIKLLITFIIVL